MQLTTSSSSGFAENNSHSAHIIDIHNDIVKTDVCHSSAHFGGSVNNLFGNNTGVPYIARWAWYKLFSLLSEDKNARLVLAATIFNGEHLRETTNIVNIGYDLNMVVAEDTTPLSYSKFHLNIIRVTRGINNTFTVLDAKEGELHRLKDLELPFIQSAHHKLRLYQDKTGTITMVTNQYDDDRTFWQMFGMLPVFYPEIKEVIENPANEEIREIFKAFYTCNGDALIPYITADHTEIERLKESTNITKFERTLKSISGKQITTIKNEIDSLQRQLNNLYSQAHSYETNLQDKKRILTGLEIIGTSIDRAALDFLKNSKTIKINNIEGNDITFRVTTPLMNYVKQDMESYYKSGNTNYITEVDWIAALMRDVFIDEKYQFVMTTLIRVPINSGNEWRVTSDSNTYTGNPHLTKYECYTPARNMMNKFINEGRILDMINQLVATCASINLVDGAVMRALVDELQNGYAADHEIIENIETGEFITPKQYQTAFYDKAKSKSDPVTEDNPFTLE